MQIDRGDRALRSERAWGCLRGGLSRVGRAVDRGLNWAGTPLVSFASLYKYIKKMTKNEKYAVFTALLIFGACVLIEGECSKGHGRRLFESRPNFFYLGVSVVSVDSVAWCYPCWVISFAMGL